MDAVDQRCDDSDFRRKQRTLKFRAWSPSHKEMHPAVALWDLICPARDARPFMFPLNPEETDSMPADLIFVQFSGLIDRNGHEIYEGDIVVQGVQRPDHYEVFFENGMFALRNEHCAGKDINPWSCEVIGNVFQNPDFLGSARTK